MAFRTITVKYPGSTCRRCGSTIQVGDKIRYGGRGLTYHLSAECPAGDGPAPHRQELSRSEGDRLDHAAARLEAELDACPY